MSAGCRQPVIVFSSLSPACIANPLLTSSTWLQWLNKEYTILFSQSLLGKSGEYVEAGASQHNQVLLMLGYKDELFSV